ncbi:MAG: FAD-dependent oxidoreductase [Actinobacteria bacterium]|nr:FAD-dependent oxidoreductase [Actinomycetota bacterium]
MADGLIIVCESAGAKHESETTEVHPASYYTDNDIGLVLRKRATELDLNSQTVSLDDGTRFEFDKVVLATGSTPRSLPVPGLDLPGCAPVADGRHSLALREELVAGTRMVAIGASWTGTEVFAVARQRGAEVVLVDPLSLPLERSRLRRRPSGVDSLGFDATTGSRSPPMSWCSASRPLVSPRALSRRRGSERPRHGAPPRGRRRHGEPG